MTATQTAPFGFLQPFLGALRRAGILFAKGCLAFAIILIAGFVAIATAAAGMALALVAILMRLFGSDRTVEPASDASADGAITLEARKTPRGWTVE